MDDSFTISQTSIAREARRRFRGHGYEQVQDPSNRCRTHFSPVSLKTPFRLQLYDARDYPLNPKP